MLDHHLDQLREGNSRLPAENLARLCRIAAQRIDLGRPKIAPIDLDVAPPVEAGCCEGEINEVVDAVRLIARDNVVASATWPRHNRR